MNRWPTTSLFLQALGLVGATLVAVFISTTVVILNIPPPAPDVYSVAEVAQAMRTGHGGQAIEGRPLAVSSSDQPPPMSNTPMRRHLNFKAGLAQVLRVGINDIVLVQNQPPLIYGPPAHLPHRPQQSAGAPDQTVIFGSFEAALRQPDEIGRASCRERV